MQYERLLARAVIVIYIATVARVRVAELYGQNLRRSIGQSRVTTDGRHNDFIRGMAYSKYSTVVQLPESMATYG